MRIRYIVQCKLVIENRPNIYTIAWLYAPIKVGDLTHVLTEIPSWNVSFADKWIVIEVYGVRTRR